MPLKSGLPATRGKTSGLAADRGAEPGVTNQKTAAAAAAADAAITLPLLIDPIEPKPPRPSTGTVQLIAQLVFPGSQPVALDSLEQKLTGWLSPVRFRDYRAGRESPGLE